MKNKLSSRPQNQHPSQLWEGWKLASHKRELEYSREPNLCSNISCGKELPYNKRNNKYCSRSCSATSNNLARSPSVKRGPTKGSNIKNYPSCQVKFLSCHICQALFTYKGAKSTKYCSSDCRKEATIKQTDSDKIAYRRRCSFNLDKLKHPTLFNDELIQLYGWYSPSNRGNNLTGLSWDHLYRINDGYQNNVDPKIMSHPANAELVPHSVNRSRTKSMITYDELLSRINLWEQGFFDLPYFYVELRGVEPRPSECKSNILPVKL